jgi:hypothetical protein
MPFFIVLFAGLKMIGEGDPTLFLIGAVILFFGVLSS